MRVWGSARSLRRATVGQAVLLLGLSLSGTPRSAFASSTYPEQVQLTMSKRLNASYCVPQCVLCHRTNLGGLKTMNLFGQSLKDKGSFQGATPSKVEQWLETYLTSFPDLDSDQDGVTDVKELEAGSSPAIPGANGENLICPDITYGCGARIAPISPERSPTEAALISLVGLASAAFAWRRRFGARPRARACR